MSEAKKNAAPSAEAIHVAKVLVHLNANRPLTVDSLALVIDEQRREARAEAFEEAAEMCRDGLDCSWLMDEAAKERAK